jgi:YggT family protein
VAGIIITLLQIYSFVVLARVLLSYFPNMDRSNPIAQFLFDITEPVLRPIREMLPSSSMIDFSPIIVFLVIRVLIVLVSNIF